MFGLRLVQLYLDQLTLLKRLLEFVLVKLAGFHEFLLQFDGLLFHGGQVVLQHAELRFGVFALGTQCMNVLCQSIGSFLRGLEIRVGFGSRDFVPVHGSLLGLDGFSQLAVFDMQAISLSGQVIQFELQLVVEQRQAPLGHAVLNEPADKGSSYARSQQVKEELWSYSRHRRSMAETGIMEYDPAHKTEFG